MKGGARYEGRSEADFNGVCDHLEPPRWGVHHPTHMKGWEAFGVVPGERLTVRRLGSGYDGKGKVGTEKWAPGETRNGVSSIEIHTFADSTDGAYIYVCGTTEQGVEKAWRRAADGFKAIREGLWA